MRNEDCAQTSCAPPGLTSATPYTPAPTPYSGFHVSSDSIRKAWLNLALAFSQAMVIVSSTISGTLNSPQMRENSSSETSWSE